MLDMSDEASINGNAVELRPTQYLQARVDNTTTAPWNKKTALIILNSPIFGFEYFRRLYEHASFRICADGGANRLHDLLLERYGEIDWAEALRSMAPNVVHGDLDSLRDDVRQRYEQLGVEISQDGSQYETDFAKAIEKVTKQVPNVQDVLVLGSLGGRIDQGIGLLHEIYREQKFRHPNIRCWFWSEASVSVLLRPGTTVIHTPLREGLLRRNIGILPIYGRAVISTKGLEWDVQHWLTEMGGNVSTSNHIMADQITITTDNEVLFTVERAIDR